MPAIVEYPHVVREAMDEFKDLFSYEPQRRHFAEYLTGLMVAANKTVTGINGEFADPPTNRALTDFLRKLRGTNRPSTNGGLNCCNAILRPATVTTA